MAENNKPLVLPDQVSQDRAIGAMLGAAIGDALGWPQERLDLRLGQGSRQEKPAQVQFEQWQRRNGSRFRAFSETIKPGEYSDDTQLILAVGRSLLNGKNWNSFFVRQELPLWSLYQRGGGRAVNRAAKIWQNKKTPWQASDAEEYFKTGANGAAMRVLPHAIVKYASVGDMLTQVMLNSALTHGHPRAILGALLHAQAAFFMLRVEHPLKFGILVEYLIDTKSEWSEMRDWGPSYPVWLEAAQTRNKESYTEVWTKTIDEISDGLKLCQKNLSEGALASGREFLEKLNAFDKSVNGSGTIAALSAIYFASLYASDPTSGLLEPAFSYGADTDTIASMVGGLLGALLGTEWIKPEWRQVQDKAYIAKLTRNLIQINIGAGAVGESVPVTNWEEIDSNRLIHQLSTAKDAKAKEFDLGPLGKSRVIENFEWGKFGKKWRTLAWKLRTEEGQTIYLSQMIEASKKVSSTQTTFLPKEGQELDISLSNFFAELQKDIPEALSAVASFRMVTEIAILLERDIERLGLNKIRVNLKNDDYLTKLADQVRQRSYPVHLKDLKTQ